jgi:hypothetical protein
VRCENLSRKIDLIATVAFTLSYCLAVIGVFLAKLPPQQV